MRRKKGDKLAKPRVERMRKQLHSQVAYANQLRWLAKELKNSHAEARAQNEQILEVQSYLEESRNRYAHLYEFAPVSYVTLNHHGIVEDINLAGSELLRSPRKSVVGLPLLLFVDPPDRRTYTEHLHRCRAGGCPQPVMAEVNLRPTEGQPATPVQFVTRLAREVAPPGFGTALIDLTERRQVEHKLMEFQQRLTTMAAELAMAEERERRRIAVEVHDNLSQTLVLAKMKLGLLGRKVLASEATRPLRPPLDEVTGLVDEVLQQTRTLTFDLSPPILYELGLEAALEWLAERVGKRHKLAVSVDARRRPSDLPEQTAVLLFQCTRELLNNTAKHANATNARVAVHRLRGSVRVTVEDDGCGFNPAVRHNGDGGGFGLFSLSARLGHIGGEVKIDSNAGGPTRVTLTVPITGA